MSNFFQFHLLTSYPGTLLNRDDAGFAKSLPFGNATRTRVSSQCLKYHWRKYEGKHAIRKAGDMAIRSRRTFRQKIADPLVEKGYDERLVAATVQGLSDILLSGDTSKGDIKDNVQPVLESDDPLGETELSQLVVLGQPEVRQIRKDAQAVLDRVAEADYNEDSVAQTRDAIADAIAVDELRSNLAALGNAMGIDAAMHGRMVTSDVMAQGDAAVHVAHAITTHAQQREDDYFTAVDDLQDETTGGTEAGSAHINVKQLTSGLFYSYVVVDLPLLVSNLEGCKREEWKEADPTLTKEVLRRFLHTITTASPGAKLSSTAPYARAEFVMVESGDEQPRTLANAFKKAVPAEGDVTEASIEALTSYAARMDDMYGAQEERICGTTSETDALPAERATLPEIADWIAAHVDRFYTNGTSS
ncbi:type I-E CRISPR-associated protein Cas7/Cse4/CasC [Salisaeta longa]|uniref:type I-E CRISPR-associated protein Cas7/Cse4/CasC n=1 Tax=Salisaeta longa TaxID=503170 RepID=UPI0003B49568|nr:type I-E CRISPR-associated protein Cas7/Cse4/CasC [Salisaeta longa]